MTTRTDTVLVTGGAGFIGTHLVDLLLADGHRVRVLDKPGVSTSHLPESRIEIIRADIRDADAVHRAARGADAVLHLAANPNLWARDPDEFEGVNHQGTRNILAAARAAGARRTVHVSTESILAPLHCKGAITEDTETTLDEMLGPYCRSKWLAEHAARQAADAGDPVVIVRPSIPIGAGDRLLGPATRMIRDYCNGRVKGHLRGDLNLIDVRDIAAGIRAAATRGEVGRRYLLVNEHWTILELLRFLAEITDGRVPSWRVPYSLALGFAHVEEFICTHFASHGPMATVTGVRLTQRAFHFDGRKSAYDLSLAPMRPCRDAIIESVRWCAEHGHIRTPVAHPTPRAHSTKPAPVARGA